jgi:hypothetical protein
MARVTSLCSQIIVHVVPHAGGALGKGASQIFPDRYYPRHPLTGRFGVRKKADREAVQLCDDWPNHLALGRGYMAESR